MEREVIREQVRAVLLERLAPKTTVAPPELPRIAPPRDVFRDPNTFASLGLGAPVSPDPNTFASLGLGAPVSWRRFDDREKAPRRALVTEADVMRARSGSKSLLVPADAIVTPLARETAVRLGVALDVGGPEVAVQAPTKTDDAAALRPQHLRFARGWGPPLAPSTPRKSVALAADHGGFGLKQLLKPFVAELGFDVLDLGTNDASPVDYPDFAHQVADAVSSRRASFGIMVDGVGVGSAMAANRHRGIRAAPCSTTLQAHSAREHNDANVLTLGGRHLGEDAAKAIVKAFLETSFGGGRHVGRVEKIEAAGRGG